MMAQAFPDSPPTSCSPALALALCVAPAWPAPRTWDWAPSSTSTEDRGLVWDVEVAQGPYSKFQGDRVCCEVLPML